MKKYFWSMLAVLAVTCMGFTSCGGDDDDDDNGAGSYYQLIGKWTLTNANGEDYNDGRHYIVFDVKGTYEVYPKNNPFGIADSGRFTYEESEVIFNNRSSATFHVDKLTKTSLILSQEGLRLTFTRDASEALDIDTEVVGKLIGKWQEKTYQFGRDEIETFNDESRYLKLNRDFTFEVNPYRLFEAEKRSGTWTLTDNGKVLMFNNDEEDQYRILQLTSTTLKLGWLEEGDVIEWVTFEKVE